MRCQLQAPAAREAGGTLAVQRGMASRMRKQFVTTTWHSLDPTCTAVSSFGHLEATGTLGAGALAMGGETEGASAAWSSGSSGEPGRPPLPCMVGGQETTDAGRNRRGAGRV